MRIYGNFCGPNHPRLEAKTRLDALYELNARPAVDDIDDSCKLHDMCYANTSTGNADCDVQMASELINWEFDHPACTRLAHYVGNGILMTTSGIRTRPEEVTVLNAPFVGAAAAFRFGLFSAGKVIGAPGAALNSSIIEVEYAQAGSPPLPPGHRCRRISLKPHHAGQRMRPRSLEGWSEGRGGRWREGR
ncbi:MAG: hypothetical protein NW215_06040 [Hyphomicrobiales bacterium]|nr:hypothetical protein [Hyphomicrobiales bacterium]